MPCAPKIICLFILLIISAHIFGIQNTGNITESEQLVYEVVFGPPNPPMNVSLDKATFNHRLSHVNETMPVSLEYVQKNINQLKQNKYQTHFKYLEGVVAPVQGCPSVCKTNQGMIGTCTQAQQCYSKGGINAGPCCGHFLVCCQVAHHCGDSSGDELVSFQSGEYPMASHGTLACDFDLHLQRDACAVRIDFHRVKLYKRFGGVCDVDQLLILNSVDGPTSAQCGDLTGYSTTVAVRPGQNLPLKVVLVIQNEGYYIWDMRFQQLKCSHLNHFQRPLMCGSKEPINTVPTFYQFLDIWRNSHAWQTPHHQKTGQNNANEIVWWRPHAPSYNRFQLWSSSRNMHSSESNSGKDFAEDRIIGGTDAELHEFPWEAAIILKRMFFCAGTLINEEFVLSAAHCFLTQDTSVSDLVVFLGDHDLTRTNDTFSEIRGVRQIHYHAHFHALRLSNDIALIHLDRPVTFSHRIRPICLPDKERINYGSYGTVAGWGITSYPDGRPNAILQKLDVEVLPNKICETTLQESLGPGNLCAMPKGRRGTCFGDSGGPLTINYNGKETLVGIVSFGITGCAVAPGQPDLYTRVSEYLSEPKAYKNLTFIPYMYEANGIKSRDLNYLYTSDLQHNFCKGAPAPAQYCGCCLSRRPRM